MALSVTHATTATGADDPTKEINKNEWNEGHTLSGLTANLLVVGDAGGAPSSVSTEDNITAFAGGGQANATQLSSTAIFHRVTTVASSNDSVKLPAAVAGAAHYVTAVVSTGTNPAVFPATGETINSGSANASIVLNRRSGVWFVCIAAGNWTTTTTSIAGTTNQVTVTPQTVGGMILSTPQDIATTSSVTWAATLITVGAADAVGAPLNFRKARGSVASPTVITTGDDLGIITALGYVGATNTYLSAASIEFDSTGTIADSTSGIGGIIRFKTRLAGTDTSLQTNLEITGGSVPTYAMSSAATIVTAGYNVGFREIPQNSQSAAYTTVLADSGKHILHPTADNNARTFTIDSNANVAYPVGTAITFVNQINTVTIAITSDTLTLAGAGTTGSRTLAANGVATALKVASTSWVISGTGLT